MARRRAVLRRVELTGREIRVPVLAHYAEHDLFPAEMYDEVRTRIGEGFPCIQARTMPSSTTHAPRTTPSPPASRESGRSRSSASTCRSWLLLAAIRSLAARSGYDRAGISPRSLSVPTGRTWQYGS
jgi:hypothetical protein